MIFFTLSLKNDTDREIISSWTFNLDHGTNGKVGASLVVASQLEVELVLQQPSNMGINKKAWHHTDMLHRQAMAALTLMIL